MRPYSSDLRLRVLKAYLSGEGSQREIARRYDVSRSFVQKLIRQYNETGSVDARPHGGGARKKVGIEGSPILQDIVARKPEATLDEISTEYARHTGVEVSVSTIHRALRSLSS